MKKEYFKLLILIPVLFLLACQEEFSLDSNPPEPSEAIFTHEPSAENDNIIIFTSPSNAIKKWDFGNGQKGEGSTVTGVYPTQGSYTVTLTIYASGGSVSSSQTIEIAETDPTLLDLPVYNFLTGGADQPEGKTWIIASTVAGHFGVGPNPSDPAFGDIPNYYGASPNEKEGGGLYNDKYTFKLADFEYIMDTEGDIYLNGSQADKFPGAIESPVGDFIAPYTAPDDLTWSITTEGDSDYIDISGAGFIGYYSGTSEYKVVSISETEMFLRYLDSAAPDLAWYIRLVPEGFTPPPPPPPPPAETSTLPIDFETVESPFNGFGGSTFTVVDNPDADDINGSAKVGQYIKGTEGNWAGLETSLEDFLDFSANKLIKYKVYSTVTGRALFKLESVDGTATPVEVFVDITKTNEWEELTFDFADAVSGTYDKFAIFLDFDNNNGGTFYFDDIRQVAEMAVLTEEALTGGGSKTWVLKPAAGSFGVGQGKGMDNYFPNGVDISGDRPCLFNDQFIFNSDGVYEYDALDDIYGEAYMGVGDGCQDESNLTGTAGETWGSGTHTFSFTPATETDPAFITVTGTGAFIALPKAFNGGEYTAGPPNENASVTYEVLSYVNNGSTETLSLTLDVSGTGETYWNFVFIAQ